MYSQVLTIKSLQSSPYNVPASTYLTTIEQQLRCVSYTQQQLGEYSGIQFSVQLWRAFYRFSCQLEFKLTIIYNRCFLTTHYPIYRHIPFLTLVTAWQDMEGSNTCNFYKPSTRTGVTLLRLHRSPFVSSPYTPWNKSSPYEKW